MKRGDLGGLSPPPPKLKKIYKTTDGKGKISKKNEDLDYANPIESESETFTHPTEQQNIAA